MLICAICAALGPLPDAVIAAAFAKDPPVALIVTNGAYELPSLTLPNVPSDGSAFAQQLINAGFLPTRIISYHDLKFKDFQAVIADAVIKYKDAAAFVFYYSGHGILYQSHARLIPTDFSIVDLQSTVRRRSVADQTIAVAEITAIGATSGVPGLFIFDACRDDGSDAGSGDFFAKIIAMDLTNAAGGSDTAVPTGRQGTFDNQGETLVRIDPAEELGHDNSLVMLAAVRSRWGPGISYALPNKAVSEFTNSLLSLMNQSPDRGLNEIFPSIKSAVVADTASFKPPQLPYDIDHTYGSVTLQSYANPPPEIEAAPLFAPTPSATAVATVNSYLDSVKQSTAIAGKTQKNYIFSAPFKLAGVSLSALAEHVQQFTSTASNGILPRLRPVAPEAATLAAVKVKLTARLWDLASDERTYGIGGTRPPVHIPSASTVTRRLAGGSFEYSQTIVADPGFRVLRVAASPTSAVNLLDFRSQLSLDAAGITSEIKTWHLPIGPDGKVDGSFAANLTVVERRPQGGDIRPLTSLIGLHADQNVVLALSKDDVQRLDTVQVLSADGAVLASLQMQDRTPLPGTNLAVSLVTAFGQPILQIESIQ
jgi:hypothetical protein